MDSWSAKGSGMTLPEGCSSGVSCNELELSHCLDLGTLLCSILTDKGSVVIIHAANQRNNNCKLHDKLCSYNHLSWVGHVPLSESGYLL